MVKNPQRLYWLGLYVFINLLCGFVVIFNGKLLGETSGLPLHGVGGAVLALVLVVFSYIFLLAYLFPLFEKIKSGRVWLDCSCRDNIFGFVVIFFQVAFICFFLATGTFVAGSSKRIDSIWSVFWVLLSVDSIFLIYYGFCREDRLFYPNLFVAIASNFLRGWGGIFVVIAFMESCRLIRSGRLRGKHIFWSILLLVLLYPFFYLLRLQIRFYFSSGASFEGLLQVAETVFSGVDILNFLEMLIESFAQIFERLHLVSSVVVVYQNSSDLQSALDTGAILPYWMEGLHGLAYGRIAGVELPPNIGVALAKLIDPFQVDVNWNSNPGYVGWFIVSPWSAFLYLLYTFFLAFLSIFLVRKMGGRSISLDMVWFAWLSFLLPGWIASFVLFVHSLCVFLMLRAFSRWLGRLRLFF